MSEIPEGLDFQGTLEWAGHDVERLHQAWQAEQDRPPPRRRSELVHALLDRLSWPAPDTDPAVVLQWAGKAGFPPGRLLAVERARPERWRREGLIARLEELVGAQRDNSDAIAPVTAPSFKQLFQ